MCVTPYHKVDQLQSLYNSNAHVEKKCLGMVCVMLHHIK